MGLPNIDNLYAPYAKDASYETSLEWWKKQAISLGISLEIMQAAIAETFIEMEAGKTFSTVTCHCEKCGKEGFPREWSCVELNHYVLNKMIEKHKKVQQAERLLIQRQIEATMNRLIRLDNEKFIKEQPVKNSRTRRAISWLFGPTNKD